MCFSERQFDFYEKLFDSFLFYDTSSVVLFKHASMYSFIQIVLFDAKVLQISLALMKQWAPEMDWCVDQHFQGLSQMSLSQKVSCTSRYSDS